MPSRINPVSGRTKWEPLTVQVTKKLTDGGTSDSVQLSILLDKAEDPREAAEVILERCTTWWLTHDTRLSDEKRAKFEEAAESVFKVPDPGKVWSVALPYFRYTFNNNFSARLLGSAGSEGSEAAR